VPAPAVAQTPAPGPVAPAPASAAAVVPPVLVGNLAVDVPIEMRVLERGRVIGTTAAATTMLAAGSHDLEFVNDAIGYRVRRAVVVQAGHTAKLRLEPPMGTLHVNAVPWAEVWIDNERIGETPIGNLPARVGTREIVFRHPELGERRTTVLVTLTGPARVSMDLRKR
jgi:hypothetical protein